MPMYLSVGVPYELLPRLNPYKCQPFIKAHTMRMEEQDALMFRQGEYVAQAIMATVGNAFGGKGAKKHEYPKKPFGINKELSKREIESQRKLVMASLQALKTNHDLQKKNKGEVN